WPIVTPLQLANWRFLLSKHGILKEFKGILNGIENGFTLNSTISISETRVFRNHSSARHNRDAVNEMVAKELAAGRYHGP
ncbi:hypothetical protein CPB86DRAFT_671244, partial [Serendipita vermifera]